MTPTTKATLKKVGKWLAIVGIAALVTILLSPAVLAVIPANYGFLVTAVLVPVLAEIDKKFFGADPHDPIPPIPVTPPSSTPADGI